DSLAVAAAVPAVVRGAGRPVLGVPALAAPARPAHVRRAGAGAGPGAEHRRHALRLQRGRGLWWRRPDLAPGTGGAVRLRRLPGGAGGSPPAAHAPLRALVAGG